MKATPFKTKTHFRQGIRMLVGMAWEIAKPYLAVVIASGIIDYFIFRDAGFAVGIGILALQLHTLKHDLAHAATNFYTAKAQVTFKLVADVNQAVHALTQVREVTETLAAMVKSGKATMP